MISIGIDASRLIMKRKERAEQGFTMVELIAVIAIITLLLAFAFIATIQFQKDLQQKELDETAKEIFIVAQNHLSTAEAQGVIARISDGKTGDSSVVGMPAKDASGNVEKGVYYFAVPIDKTTSPGNNIDDSKTVLGQMLPFGSIDETIRDGGSYIIKYSLDDGSVLDVFFARAAGSFPFTGAIEWSGFNNDDYAKLFNNSTGKNYYGSDADAKKNRQDYAYAEKKSLMVGWFGGEEAKNLESLNTDKPMLKVENDDYLKAIVDITVGDETASEFDDALNLKLLVTGVKSKNSKVIELLKSDGGDKTLNGQVVDENGISIKKTLSVDGKSMKIEAILDDITSNSTKFYNLFCADAANALIPGEQVVIQAISSSSTKLAVVKKSAKVERNSLFADLNADTHTVGITSIRHLENLTPSLSQFDTTTTGVTGNEAINAVQRSDISWADFKKNTDAPATFAYTPVNTQITDSSSYVLNYSGKGYEGDVMHLVSDVVIESNNTDPVGMFSTFKGGSVRDVALSNFSINAVHKDDDGNAEGGDAGALAGRIEGTSVSGVLAFNERIEDNTLEVVGGEFVGGLVGRSTASVISNCAANIYVRALGDAGGLIGSVSGDNAVIERSYTAAHTLQGNYSEDTDSGSERSYPQGRMNVIGGANAGGLVGSSTASSLTIDSCYSMASVYSSSASGAVGGLVGKTGNATLLRSYTTSLLRGEEIEVEGVKTATARGIFIGARNSDEVSIATKGEADTVENTNIYFDIVNYADNEKLNDIAMSGANMADLNAESYVNNMNKDGQNNAVNVHDRVLLTYYRGKFPFQTIKELTGLPTLPEHLNVHYGDWPSLETFVINQSTTPPPQNPPQDNSGS